MKHKVRFPTKTSVSLVSFFLTGCLSFAGGPKVDREVKRLAGPDAKSCGLSLFANIAEKHNKCALDAAASRTPFWVRYEIRGDKTTANRGIAMDGIGKIFIVTSEDGSTDSTAKVAECRSGRLALDPQVTELQVLKCAP